MIPPPFVVVERALRDRVTAILAFVLADIEPLLQALRHGTNFRVANWIVRPLPGVIPERKRFFACFKCRVGVTRLSCLAGISNLIRRTFCAWSFSYVGHTN